MSHKLRIAFVHQIDPRRPGNSWLGTLHFLKRAVERHIGEVADIGPAPINDIPYRVAGKLVRAATGKRYSYHHEPSRARRIGAYFSRELHRGEYDLLFSPAGSAVIPYLETDLPVIYFSDATWRTVRNYHTDFSNTLARIDRGADELERRTLDRADVILYPSEWAALSAMEDYGISPSKVFVNNIGANLLETPPRRDVLPRRLGRRLRLLMVGVSWQNKGGELAYRTLVKLLAMGYNAELTVVGCSPPPGVSHARMLVIPFLNKLIPEEWERFRRLWHETDLFILPTRFEAAGLVFCEANAYGLPAIGTRTGGVPSLVRDGVNGYTLNAEEWVERSAELIAGLAEEPARYADLCESSRDEFERRLNWDAWGEGLVKIVAGRLPHLAGDLVAARR